MSVDSPSSGDSPRPDLSEPRTWTHKFRDAFRGVASAIRTQNSCHVHLFATVAVIVAGFVRNLSTSDWCLITLAIGGVWTAELFNSALESLARAINRRPDPHIATALDMASGAVLVMAFAAAVLGGLVFLK